jgi:[acyl-carrier-protein] S-malonyltransferase
MTAILFPGQGAQHVGMGRDLAASLPAAKALFDHASAVLGYDLLAVCTTGPAERLNATDVSQPAIFVASLAALEQVKATQPDLLTNVTATAGLSLGEYTALVFAGALPFEDALRVVKARGEAMQAAAEATAGGMVAVLGLEADEVDALAAEAEGLAGGGKKVQLANLLCPGNTVVSGHAAAIDALVQLAEGRQLRTSRLAVAGAFHTDLMKPADEKLAAALATATFRPANTPVWSNVDARPHTAAAEFAPLLVKQVLSPVRWEETMRGMIAAGVDKFVEVGPGRVLAGLLKRVNRKADVTNVGV